ncbi:MAG: response regulator [Bacteroidota bacterium]
MTPCPKKNTKILIVDDDHDDQFIIKKIFRSILPATEIAQAYNGIECLNYLEANLNELPDLITMDINMPLVNGIEATISLKNDERFKGIPLVVLSTSDRKNDMETVLQNGADDYFIKPIVYDELNFTLKSIADKWLRIDIQ